MPALARFVGLKSASGREPLALPESELSRGLSVTGTLDCEGELRVHGTVRGRINTDRLVIAPDGFVEGDIVAREASIAGRLKGRVFAFTVTIEASADITGRIFHHTVTVARGARFDGRMPWRPLNYFESLDQLPEVQP
jgi:cytoskeletal protein CcmA (bactofilin family)